jgi:DNA polymerase (family 10)
MREGIDELELAEAHALPQLIELKDIAGTFHNHTKASDGRNTLEEMAIAAAKMGLQYIGIADHSKASFQANGLDTERLLAQIDEIRELNRKTGNRAWLFAGCEIDILKDGSLDLEHAVTSKLDYCVISVHASMTGISEDDMTARIIRAIETDTGCLKILGHPTGRLLLRREGYPVNLRRVIDAAAANRVMIEFNANPHRMDMDWRYWRHAAESGVACVITPDAHATEQLEYLRCGVQAVRKAGLSAEQVFNTRSLEEVRKILA